MEMIILALICIVILMLCFLIFSLGRIFENTIIIRELDEKIELLNCETSLIIKRMGEDK